MHHDLLQLTQVRAACRSGAARTIRCAAGLSQSELAAALGVDDTTVARWEAGERTPRMAVGLRYAELLNELETVVRSLPVSA